ncbi:hypothetical protein BZG36_05629 [Bifiguratus adelaidae]|uniref:Uncharacterized protein n=1 Tax=Bifiguratus adelaidae TaxID=1938954 RepID=A0A261XTE3_9FUNG|nr:hypothetical protein BZG36_05629 [Bifiguratus adelaidae]
MSLNSTATEYTEVYIATELKPCIPTSFIAIVDHQWIAITESADATGPRTTRSAGNRLRRLNSNPTLLLAIPSEKGIDASTRRHLKNFTFCLRRKWLSRLSPLFSLPAPVVAFSSAAMTVPTHARYNDPAGGTLTAAQFEKMQNSTLFDDSWIMRADTPIIKLDKTLH